MTQTSTTCFTLAVWGSGARVNDFPAGTSVGQRRSGWPSPSARCRSGLPGGSLLGSANDVAALHERAKQNPGKRFDDGVALIRQAVAILQRILPADD